ncbi:MAG: PEP-CTERM sorting domain-containing protein [Planctomycetota bacterium]
MTQSRYASVSVLAALLWTQSAVAVVTSVSLPGSADFDAWDNLTRTNPQVATADPIFPNFPGSALWPEPIESLLTFNTFSSSDDDPTGDALFDKVSGNGYPAGISIYTSPNGSGVFKVFDTTPVTDIETLIFQIEIGSGSEFGVYLEDDPTLYINGDETTNIGYVASDLSVAPPFDSGFGPVPVGTLRYQWDLRGLGPISEVDVRFETAGTSSTILALQLDQSDTFALVIPEPNALLLFGLSGAVVCGRRRRAAAKI